MTITPDWPAIKLSSLHPNHYPYSEHTSSCKEWNRFFTKLGVYDDLGFIVNSNYQKYTELKKSYPDYCEFIFNEKIISTEYSNPKYIYQHEIQNFSCMMFEHFFNKYVECAKLVFNYLVPRLNEKSKENSPTYYWVYNRRMSFDVTPYWLFALHKEPCFPTTLGDCRRAEEVIITNEFREIAGNCLPILDLTKDACKWLLENNLPFINCKLPFITELTLDHYLKILSYLAENNENRDLKDLKEQVTLIYSKISSLLAIEDDIAKVNIWRLGGKILALDGKFYDPSSLYCLPEKQFSIEHEKNRFIALAHVDKSIIFFLEQLNIQVLSSEQINLRYQNAIPDNSLKNRILNRVPLIASIIPGFTQDVSKVFDSLWIKIYEYQFLRVDSLNLIILNKPQQSEDFGFDSSSIYFVGDWHSPKILYKIVEKLCSIWELDPNNFSHKIDFILRSSIDNGKDWLKENGYNIEKLDILLSKVDEFISHDNMVFSINYNDRTISTVENDSRSLQKQEYDQETGRLGESLIFEQLQKCYLSYYSNQGDSSQQLAYNNAGFDIGNTTVIWNNKSSESNSPYDFKIIHNGNYYFLEVKSTTLSEFESDRIYLSPNEWAFFKTETTGNYFIARVFSVRNNPVIRMIRLNSMEFTLNKDAGIFKLN